MAGVQLHGVQATAALAIAAAAVLEASDEPEHVAPHVVHMGKALDDWHPGVRIAAARSLADAGLAHAGPHAAAMAQRICSNDAVVLRNAEANLKNMGDVGAKALSDILSNRNETVRTNAIMALGKMGATGARVLVTHLADKDESVRHAASKQLAQQGEISAPFLAESLKDPDGLIRINAAKSLGWMASSRDQSAVASQAYIPDLLNALDDSSCEGGVRISAAEALMAMGPNGGEALASRLEDDNPEVRRTVASSLLRMGDNGIVVLARCLGADASPSTRRHALALLSALGPCGATALAVCLEDFSDAGVRRRAAEGLGQMDAEVAAPHIAALAARLEDKDHWVQVAAARSLGKLGISIGVADAAVLLQPFSASLASQTKLGERKLVRHSAAQALGRAGAEVARPYAQDLASGLGDKDFSVRTNAAEGLSEMGEVGPAAAENWLRKNAEEPRARSRVALCRSGLLTGEVFNQAYRVQ